MMKLKKENRLRSKFGRKLTLILTISILLPVILVGSILFMSYNAYVQKDVAANNEGLLSDVQSTIEVHLDGITSLLTILSKVDYVQKMQPAVAQSMFMNTLESNALLSNIIVLDDTGKIKFATNSQEGQLKSNYITSALSGKMTYSEIKSFTTNAGTRKVIHQALPITDDSGKVRGVLIGEISFSDLVNLVTSLKLPDYTDVMILATDASILAHSDAELFNKIQKNKFTNYVPYQEAQLDVTETKTSTYQEIEYLMTFSKIKDLDWTIITQIPTDRAFESLNRMTLFFIIVLCVVFIAAYVLSKAISNYTTKPLKRISEAAGHAKEGDFTHEVDALLLKRSDEFGELGVAFSAMMDSFKDIISHLIKATEILDLSTEKLVTSSDESTEILSEIIVQAGQLSRTAQDDIDHANEVVKSISEMSEGSENVAKNTDMLNGLIKNNVTFATTGADMMKETSSLIDKAVISYTEIESKMKSLQTSAKNIGSITDTILNISGQTNLLALNAAIEAARAGEAGRGFAVVANEIRNLADQSNKSAGNITHLITGIQEDIAQTHVLFDITSKFLHQVVEESQKTMMQIQEILVDSQKAALEIDEISAVTEEHAATTAHIDEKMNSMLETITETLTTANAMAVLIDEQNNKNQDTIQKIDDINAVSDQFKNLIGRFLLDPTDKKAILSDEIQIEDIEKFVEETDVETHINAFDEINEDSVEDVSDDYKEEV